MGCDDERTGVRQACKGFTLMEMLIVVAIIAVLVAIAIPVFNSVLENARKATCDANCRSLTAVVKADYMTDGTSFADAFAKEFATGQYTCPDNGTISCDSATGIVSCNIHGTDSSSTPFQKDDIQSLADDFASVLGKLLSGSTTFKDYSTATYNGVTYPYMNMSAADYSTIDGKKVIALLKDAGLSDTQAKTLANAKCMIALSPDKKTVYGAAYVDPNDSSKMVLLYADGTKVSVSKATYSGQYLYYLADKSRLP